MCKPMAILACLVTIFTSAPAVTKNTVEVWFLAPVNTNIDYDYDLEIRTYMTKAAAPLIEAAAMPQPTEIFIVKNKDISASVFGNGQIFVYAGLVDFGDSPLALQGVLAHEISHATGDHILHGTIDLQTRRTEATAALLAGLLASSALLLNENTAAAAPPALLGSFISSQHNFAQEMYSSYRKQESAADVAAVHLMQKVGLPATGLIDFFTHLHQISPDYFRKESEFTTHPVDMTRKLVVEATQATINKSGKLIETTRPMTPAEKEQQQELERARAATAEELVVSRKLVLAARRAKIASQSDEAWQKFIARLDLTLFEDRYAQIIGLIIRNQFNEGLTKVQILLGQHPDHKLLLYQQGRILFYQQKYSDAEQTFRKLQAGFPDEGAFLIYLARTLLAQDQLPRKRQQARALLESITFTSKQSSQVLYAAWRLLEQIHRQDQDTPRANIARAAATFYESVSMLQVNFFDRSPALSKAVRFKLTLVEKLLDEAVEELGKQNPYAKKALLLKHQASLL